MAATPSQDDSEGRLYSTTLPQVVGNNLGCRTFSDQEQEVLQRAAAILAVSVHDLSTSLPAIRPCLDADIPDNVNDPTSFLSEAPSREHDFSYSFPDPNFHPLTAQPTLTLSTPIGSAEYMNASANSLEPVDEMLVSPSTWHSGSIESSQCSPELGSHAVTFDASNDITVLDDLSSDLSIQPVDYAQTTTSDHILFGNMFDATFSNGSASFAWPEDLTIGPSSGSDAGYNVSNQQLVGGLPDSRMPYSGASFAWPVNPTVFTSSSFGTAQSMNETLSSFTNEWLGQTDGLTSMSYNPEPFSKSYLAKFFDSNAPSKELYQPLLSESPLQISESSIEDLPISNRLIQQVGQGEDAASSVAVQGTNHPTSTPITASSRTLTQHISNSSQLLTNASEVRARYQSALPGSDHMSKPRQAFRDMQQRLDTGDTRRRGACVRCRMQRVRCLKADHDAQGGCLTCLQLSKRTLANLPCVRYKITESRLFDKGKHPQYKWSKRWSSWDMMEIETWQSSEVKVITVTQDVFGGSTFDIACRKFIPAEGDSLERTWKKNGVTQYYPRAPYAIANMRETGNAIARFVASKNGPSIQHFINVKHDRLLQSTYAMAYAMVFHPTRFAQNEDLQRLLQEVFQMWVAIRMESQSECICGKETLGMEPQFFDKEVNTYGTNSIPPIMSAQIELITTTRVLHPMKTSILRRLQRLIQANKFRNWFGIYLCLFILLHSCSILTSDENRAAKKYGLTTRYVYNAFIEELHNGSKTMLYYFHYNNKGSHPFTRDWTSENDLAMAELNAEQATFLVETAEEIKRRACEFEDIRKSDEFENDFYFVAQLYDMDWKPSFTT